MKTSDFKVAQSSINFSSSVACGLPHTRNYLIVSRVSASELEKRNSRNAQVKMFETIAVLIVFFFLLVASAAVYFSVQKVLFKQKVQELSEERNLQLTQNILALPELDCSFASVQKENCFDAYKISAFSRMLSQEKNVVDYFPVFGYSEILITTVYPERKIMQLYANKPTVVRAVLLSHYPVLFYNATANTYSFAVIEVKSYAA